MLQVLSQRQRRVRPRQGLLRIAQHPQGPPGKGQAPCSRVKIPVAKRQGMVLLRVVDMNALLEMGVRLGQLAEREPAYSQGLVGLQEECRGVETPGQAETLLPELPRRLMLGSSQIQQPQAKQHWKELWGFFDLLAEFTGTGVGRCHFRRRDSSGGYQSGAERGLEGQFRLDALRRVR